MSELLKSSLLWKGSNLELNVDNPEVESIIEDTVFEDLKIRRVLETVYDNYSDSDEVIKVLKCIPNIETLKYRQEIFEDFLADNGKVTEVYYELIDICSRYEIFINAYENVKKRLSIVMYNYNLFNFLEKVMNIINSTYKSKCLTSISKSIESYLSRKADVRVKTNNLYERAMKILSLSANYHDGAPYIQLYTEKQENLEDDLLDIADKLDIKLEKAPRLAVKKEINPYFLHELVNGDEKLKQELINYHEENRIDVLDISDYIPELKYYTLLKTLFEYMQDRNVPICKANYTDKVTNVTNGYDISLVASKINTIPNDFIISDDENVQFILGVNSGGKTCYLRSVGINYILANVCGFMFAEKADIYPVKFIFTHFPNEENYKVGEGRLIDELNRLNRMKKNFCSESISLLNETFSSTSEERACELTFDLLDSASKTKAKILYVTHQYKIFDSIQDSHIGFYTPQVVEGETNIRTHKIVKVEKKLLSYVGDILKKHGMTREQLLKRKKSE